MFDSGKVARSVNGIVGSMFVGTGVAKLDSEGVRMSGALGDDGIK